MSNNNMSKIEHEAEKEDDLPLDIPQEQAINELIQEADRRLSRLEDEMVKNPKYAEKLRLRNIKKSLRKIDIEKKMTKEERAIVDYNKLVGRYLKKVLATGEKLDPTKLSYLELNTIKAYEKAKDDAIKSLKSRDLVKSLKELPRSDLAFLLLKSKGRKIDYYDSAPTPDPAISAEIDARTNQYAEWVRMEKEKKERQLRREFGPRVDPGQVIPLTAKELKKRAKNG